MPCEGNFMKTVDVFISMIEGLSTKKVFAFAFLLGVLLFSIPFLSRSLHHEPLFSGEEAFYDINLIAALQQEFTVTDTALGESRPWLVTPYHLLLSQAARVFGFLPSFVLFHLLILGGSLYFLLLCFDFFKSTKTQQLLFLFIFLLSPLTFYLFAMPNASILIFFLCVLAAWIRFTQRYQALLCIIFVLLPFFGIWAFLLGCALLLLRKPTLREALCLFVPAILYFFWISATFGFPALSLRIPFSSLFADLGNVQGYGVFTFLLAAMGIAFGSEFKKQHRLFFFMALFTLFLFVKPLLVYQNLFICIFASYTFLRLAQRAWSLPSLKEISLLLLFCGILFTGLSNFNHVSLDLPSSEVFQGMHWLQEHGIGEGKVLTEPAYGFWVSGVTGSKLFLDTQTVFSPFSEERMKDLATIVQSRDLSLTTRLLDQYGVRYLLLLSSSEKDLSGLLFILGNREMFKKIYENNAVTIWEYSREQP